MAQRARRSLLQVVLTNLHSDPSQVHSSSAAMLVPNNIVAGNRLGLQLQAIRRMRQAEQGAFSRAYLRLGERLVHLILSAG
jgi:hypothetical protein